MAYIAGLQPGIAVTVPIVVVAEDGVTSSHYYLQVLRGELPTDDSSNSSELLNLWGLSPGGAPTDSLDSSTMLMTANPEQPSSPPPPPLTSVWQAGECPSLAF